MIIETYLTKQDSMPTLKKHSSPRFARPWRVEAAPDRFLVKDAAGMVLATIAFSREGGGAQPSEAEAQAMAAKMVASAELLTAVGDFVDL